MFVYTTKIRLLDRVRAASRQRWQIATAIAAAAMIDLLKEAHFHIMYIASVIIPSVTLLQHVCEPSTSMVKRKNEPETSSRRDCTSRVLDRKVPHKFHMRFHEI